MSTMTAAEKADLYLEDRISDLTSQVEEFARDVAKSAAAPDFTLIGQTIQNGAKKAIVAEARLMVANRVLRAAAQDGLIGAAEVADRLAEKLWAAANRYDPTAQPASVVAGAMDAVQVVANLRAADEARGLARILRAL